jgi:hypothetical protein
LIRVVGSLFKAAERGFLDGIFDRFTGFASAFLNTTQQFILLAFGKLGIVIREISPLLFQLAPG